MNNINVITNSKPVPLYEGKYIVFDDGRVYSTMKGDPRNRKAKFLKPTLTKQGYLDVTFTKDGKRKHHTMHRLVGEAFIPNPDNKPCINHKNGVRTDNRVENLEWVTHKENTAHAEAAGKMKHWGEKKGANNPAAKLTEDHVLAIKQLLAGDTFNQREIGVLFGVKNPAITNIKLGKTWSHLASIDLFSPDQTYKIKLIHDENQKEKEYCILEARLAAVWRQEREQEVCYMGARRMGILKDRDIETIRRYVDNALLTDSELALLFDVLRSKIVKLKKSQKTTS